VQEVDKLVEKDASLWWALTDRAIAKRHLGRKDESIKDFDAALAAAYQARNDDGSTEIIKTMADVIGPDEVISRLQARAEKEDRWKILIAQMYMQKGDNASAAKTVEQVLAHEEALMPLDRERSMRLAGMLYLMMNQPNKSAAAYEKLLKQSPDDMVALNNIAYLLGESVQPPRPQDGVKYSQHAYELMQQRAQRDVLVLDTHGWLLVLSNRVDEGIEVLRIANETKSIPDAHYHLAEAYLKKGVNDSSFVDQAQRELELALDLVKRAEQLKQPVDQALRGKIENAQGRAALMTQQKKSAAANAPTGTNVP
jgi:tetratricopeptide (TPR) repeat protein